MIDIDSISEIGVDCGTGIFTEIKNDIEKREDKFDGPAPWAKRLKFNKGKYYLVRLLPYLKEGKDIMKKKSTLKTYTYRFIDANSHKATYVLSPRTFGEECPFMKYVSNYRETHKGDDDAIKKLNDKLRCTTRHLVNALLIDTDDDIKNEKYPDQKSAHERIGEVVVLELPNSLWNVVAAAARGDADKKMTEELQELQPKAAPINLANDMWNPNPGGMNLRISSQWVEKLGGYNDYGVSSFTWSKRDLKKSPDELKQLLEECADLYKCSRRYTYDEAEKVLREGFLGLAPDVKDTPAKEDNVTEVASFESALPSEADVPKVAASSDGVDDLKEMDDFLNDLPDDI